MSELSHYVSCAYFTAEGKYIESKILRYSKEDAEKIFQRTWDKYKADPNTRIILTLRSKKHTLIQAERNFTIANPSKKKKKGKK